MVSRLQGRQGKATFECDCLGIVGQAAGRYEGAEFGPGECKSIPSSAIETALWFAQAGSNFISYSERISGALSNKAGCFAGATSGTSTCVELCKEKRVDRSRSTHKRSGKTPSARQVYNQRRGERTVRGREGAACSPLHPDCYDFSSSKKCHPWFDVGSRKLRSWDDRLQRSHFRRNQKATFNCAYWFGSRRDIASGKSILNERICDRVQRETCERHQDGISGGMQIGRLEEGLTAYSETLGHFMACSGRIHSRSDRRFDGNICSDNSTGLSQSCPSTSEADGRKSGSEWEYRKHVCETVSGCQTPEGTKPLGFPRGFDGGAEGNRTPDLYNAIVALSQLSYSPRTLCGGIIRECWPPVQA